MNLPGTTETLHLGSIVMTLVGGLALFLFGMEQMTEALKMAAGGKMRWLLARMTANRFKALFAGTLVTAIIQSSSVTTVLVVGFIAAGLMTLSQSVGLILGADIGTTITVQIIAFKVTGYALALVAVGFGLLCVRRERIRQYGTMLMGLGLLFYGMELMSGATRPLHGYPAFLALMRSMGNPLFGILAGTVMTALIHSSAATIGIVIVLASQGFVSIEAGIALVFGANIGTCATAVLAAVGRPREAVRAAVIHVLFKVLGIAIWYAFIDQLALLVQWLSPADPGLEGAARLAAETPRQIANAHTIFNVGNALIFVWLTDPLVRLVRFIVPDRPGRGPEAIQPKYLDDSLLGTPELALDRARMELRRLGACAVRMVREALNRVVHGDDEDLKALARMDNDVDALHAAIIAYLGRLSLRNLTKAQSARVYDLIAVANYTENIGDMIETNLVAAGQERLKLGVAVSKGTQDVLLALHEKVLWTVKRSLSAHAKSDFAVAVQVVAAKDDINRLAAEADSHLARRLVADEPNRLAAFRIESDLIENLRRVYYFAKRIAKMAAEATAAPSGAEALPFDDEGLAGYGSG